MIMTPVTTSSLIKAIGYDEASQTLRVHYKTSDTIYEYSDVTRETYEAVLKADSMGKALRILVINGSTSYCRIS